MLPVLFVLGVTAIKDAYEDRRRYLSDNKINKQTCRVFVGGARGRYVKETWQNVKVGECGPEGDMSKNVANCKVGEWGPEGDVSKKCGKTSMLRCVNVGQWEIWQKCQGERG